MTDEDRKKLAEIKLVNGTNPFSAVGYDWLISALEAEAKEVERHLAARKEIGEDWSR